MINEFESEIGFVHLFLHQIYFAITPSTHLLNYVIVQGWVINFK
jgi:hypothetical protein